ncbi:hypothetical protein AB0H71_13670 [Nocardia sp. NPDC050697]|uniref:hypothetical protein n=1 Tax=Nocardia sp. NPDC050697 TaxID=3155158 RepID=UPI0033ED98CC
MSDFLRLTLIGVSGRRWVISGPGQGADGPELMPKPKQFYDSPATTYWIKSGGELQKYQGFSFKRRDPLFGLVISGDSAEDEAEIHSQVRMDLGMYDQQFELEAETTRGEVRRLKMRLLEDPKAYETGDWEGKDPHLFGVSTLWVSAAAEMPHWYGDPVTASWTLTSGTSGSTSAFEHPGNPGDVVIHPRWSLNAPAKWTIPDPSLGQEVDFQRPPGADADKDFPVVQLLAGEDLMINTNGDKAFMLTHDGGMGPWMRSNGAEAIYPVAPHTEPFETTVSVTNAVPGVTATIECDRWFSRPFGVSL